MKIGLLMFPSPHGSAAMAQTTEQLGFDSMVFRLRLGAFVDHNPVVPWGVFELDRDGESIVLSYTVPEPPAGLIVLLVWMSCWRLRCSRPRER